MLRFNIKYIVKTINAEFLKISNLNIRYNTGSIAKLKILKPYSVPKPIKIIKKEKPIITSEAFNIIFELSSNMFALSCGIGIKYATRNIKLKMIGMSGKFSKYFAIKVVYREPPKKSSQNINIFNITKSFNNIGREESNKNNLFILNLDRK